VNDPGWRFPRRFSLSLKYVIGYTWEDFLCAETIGPTATRLPCDRSDPLMCTGGRHQYGIFSYGYDDTGAYLTEAAECGDTAIQSRHLFVNRHAGWIAETMAKLAADQGGISHKSDDVTDRTTVRRYRSTRPQPTTSSTRVTVPEDAYTERLEVDYPYLVYLEGLPDEPVCGGTLVSPRHVLTTAYCTSRMTEIAVWTARSILLYDNVTGRPEIINFFRLQGNANLAYRTIED